jgi:hypothetical protein
MNREAPASENDPTRENDLAREEIALILERHHGAKAEIARRAKVKSNAVSMWLWGGTNANVRAHAERYARELVAKELQAAKELLRTKEPSARDAVNSLRQRPAKSTGTKGTGGE